MEQTKRITFISIILGLGVNFLISCAPKVADHGGVQPPHSPTIDSGGSNPPRSQGTSDSGGGTGVDGKVFESYIVDPAELPAFAKYVKPLFQNILSSEENKPSKYDLFFKMKIWYIAPVDLDKIGKDILGVSFLKTETQQIARQSMKEVWIDKRIFEKMSEKDQAELLIHEMVMSMYFLKFVSVGELCKASQMLSGEKDQNGCVNMPDYVDKAMPAEKLRPLNEEDNERIRFVTGWLLQNAQKPMSETSFVQLLHYKEFDKRFFNPENYKKQKEKPVDLKVSKKMVLDALRASQLTGFMPEICTDGGRTQSVQCRVEVIEKNVKFNNFPIPAIEVRVLKKEDGEVLSSVVTGFGDEINLVASSSVNDRPIYTLTGVDMHESYAIGDKVQFGILLFQEVKYLDQKKLLLESIVVKKGVIVSIDKNRNPICEVMVPKSKNLFEDGIIVHKEVKDPLLVESAMFTIIPSTMCTAQNVK